MEHPPSYDSGMGWRRAGTIVVVVLGFALAGCPTGGDSEAKPAKPAAVTGPWPDGIEGFYRLDDPAQYGAAKMSEVPPGQVRHLAIEKGRWMMRDMMSGIGDAWTPTATGGKLEITEGPAGPIDSGAALTATRTKGGLCLEAPDASVPPMSFTYVESEAPKDFGMDEFLGPKK